MSDSSGVWRRASPFRPLAVGDVELSGPLEAADASPAPVGDYDEAVLLARLHGHPVGYVRVPVANGRCAPDAIASAVAATLPAALVRRVLRLAIATGTVGDIGGVDALFERRHAATSSDVVFPSLTVAVCSNRPPDDTRPCLDALQRLSYPGALDVLIVDNTPGATHSAFIRERYPSFRCVREERPGLNWARNRALGEVRGQLVAFTDDDAMADPDWATALALVFARCPGVGAVTGFVGPATLEREVHLAFEQYGGFGRGVERIWWSAPRGAGPIAARYGNPGALGTGTSMAFDREVFGTVGGFAPWLDAGTLTGGGGDLDILFRVLKGGWSAVYEPAAVVRHRHRDSWESLRAQLFSWGSAMAAHVLSNMHSDVREVPGFLVLAVRSMRQRWVAPMGRASFPRELVGEEMRGAVAGLGRYLRSRRASTALRLRYPGAADEDARFTPRTLRRFRTASLTTRGVRARARLALDLDTPLTERTYPVDADGVDLVVTRGGRALGAARLDAGELGVYREQLIDAMAAVGAREWLVPQLTPGSIERLRRSLLATGMAPTHAG